MRLASLMLAMGLGLAACAPTQTTTPTRSSVASGVYGARTDSGPNGQPIEIHAVRNAYLTDRNTRQRVAYNGSEAPGTIVVDPYARYLYHVIAPGEAIHTESSHKFQHGELAAMGRCSGFVSVVEWDDAEWPVSLNLRVAD